MKKDRQEFSRTMSRFWSNVSRWSVCLMICCFGVLTVQAQTSSTPRVSLDVKDVSLIKIIESLRVQTHYDFLFNSDELRGFSGITVKFNAVTLQQALDSLLIKRKTGLDYTVKDKMVVIKRAVSHKVNTITITGTITDASGGTLPGATVMVKGSEKVGIATAADANGKYTLRGVPENAKELLVSFVGLKTRVISINGRKTIDVKLEEAPSDLDEVVVRAYGTQNKREVVSAISSVKAEEMKELPTASIVSMLQGRLAGVNITNQSGAPGSAAVVAIRGFNSLLFDGASDGQPLYVIDGVPIHSFVSPVTGTNTLSDIDPSMIESVEVLKDASAASIYGSRAGNGVILITTKKGRAGQSKFSANVSYTMSQLMEYPVQTGGRMERYQDVLWKRSMKNQYAYRDELRNQMQAYPSSYEEVYAVGAGVYDGFWGSGKDTDGRVNRQLQDSLNPFWNNQTNWWKQVFKTGKILNANLQCSGGSERFQYMVGAGYYAEDGIMINSGYSRANLLTNLTVKPTDRLRLDVRISGSYMNRSFNALKGFKSDRFEGMTASPSNQTTLTPATEGLEEKWLAQMNAVEEKSDDYRALGSVLVEYQILKGLTFSARGSLDFTQSNLNVFRPGALDLSKGFNRSEGKISRTAYVSNEELLRYRTSIQEKHNIELLAGFDANKNQVFYIGGWGLNQPTNYIYYYNPLVNGGVREGDGAKIIEEEAFAFRNYSSDFKEKAMVSYFGRASYNYKQRYLLEASVRRDGSSTFGEAHKWATFPSYAVGWAFSEESFMKWAHWLDWGKVRFSYGTSGQIFTEEYLAHGLMRISGQQFLGTSGVTVDKLIAPDLTWEKTEQYNLGLDLDLYDHRVNLKLDYYYKYTSSLIYRVPLPGNMFTEKERTENAMAISNEGVELEIKVDVLRQGPLSWRTKFNISRIWNRFEESYSGRDIGTDNVGALVIGRPIYGMKVYMDDGYYQDESEVPQYYTSNGLKVYLGKLSINHPSGLVGTPKIEDLNGDMLINPDDYYFHGTPQPLAYGGWVNELRWKNFDLNMLFNFSLSRNMINSTPIVSLDNIGAKLYDARDLDFWEKPGDNGKLPRRGVVAEDDLLSRIETVSSVSLKQLTLGYDLPTKMAQKAGFKGLRVFLTGENLFYLSNYSGGNPEVVNIYSGKDVGDAYPLPRKWSVGLTLNF